MTSTDEFPMKVKKMTDEETKEYHLKRLERLCKESKNLEYGKDGV